MAAGEEILAARRLTDVPISGDIARLRCLHDHSKQVVAFLVSLGYEQVRCEPGVAAPTP
jgi:hypothetical protein